jgi:hypothetical protein
MFSVRSYEFDMLKIGKNLLHCPYANYGLICETDGNKKSLKIEFLP